MWFFCCSYHKDFRRITEQGHTSLIDLLAAEMWYIKKFELFFLFVGCIYSDWPVVSIPNISLDDVSVCVSLVVSSGVQSSKGSVFPVTVLWQKHLHTVTHSDQPNQLSAGKSYRENVYDPLERILKLQPRGSSLLPHTNSFFFFFLCQAECSCMFFLIYICMALSRILSSVLV